MEIIQGNKLIAEFMGWTYFGWNDPRLIRQDEGKRYESGWKKRANAPMIGKLRKNDYLCGNHKQLQYYNSWDWIMPVVGKCFDLTRDDYSNYEFLGASLEALLESTLIHTNIQGTWHVLINFIEWYNENK